MRRPQTWDDLIGQSNAQQLLKASIQVAIKRNRALPHILLTGPAGTGKTTIAYIIAQARATQFTSVTSTSITSPRDVALMVAGQEVSSILFIDEIHRMPRRVQETFYSVMEDFHVTWKAGRTMAQLDLEPFTVIGATTDTGLLLKPMRDRFGLTVQLEAYSIEQLSTIVFNYCDRSEIPLGWPPTEMKDDRFYVPTLIAERCKGTPRIALNLTDRAYEISVMNQTRGGVSKRDLNEACGLIGIDEHGLDRDDRTYLKVLADAYPEPVALRTLSSRCNIAEVTILTAIEPYLMKEKMVEIGTKGRVLKIKLRDLNAGQAQAV